MDAEFKGQCQQYRRYVWLFNLILPGEVKAFITEQSSNVSRVKARVWSVVTGICVICS